MAGFLKNEHLGSYRLTEDMLRSTFNYTLEQKAERVFIYIFTKDTDLHILYDAHRVLVSEAELGYEKMELQDLWNITV